MANEHMADRLEEDPLVQEIMDKAQSIQEGVHKRVSFIVGQSSSGVTVQDATNVCLYELIASLTVRVDHLVDIIKDLKTSGNG